ncbi:rnhA operon protein [Haloarchaeobius amylolyticus]|uniref:RnhA operon protein n=1 Tax=Haloarchaeobius amylolyticus TaxID=1198296 RepID=A0ABD6BD86_9EURY
MTEPNAIDAGEDDDTSESDDAELPRDVVDEVERLTRLERTAVDDNEATAYEQRRDDLLDEHDFTSRIRDDEGDDVLVLHPEEWHEDGVIRTDRIEDIDRAVEIPLEGTGDPDDWDDVEAHNRDLVATVREAHGEVHGDNAATLADFAGNHYAKPIESLTGDELGEFRTEYFVRNAWPSEKQQKMIDESIELVFEAAGERVPERRF